MAERCEECFKKAESEDMEAKANHRDEWTSAVKETEVFRGP
jgi:hypothetical protein